MNNKQITHDLTLWYRKPAQRWFEALPLGNGRLAAMVYGGMIHECLALTESTCWAGEASTDNSQEGAAALLPEVRTALSTGEYAQAEALCQRMTGNKLNYGTNLPLGNLRIAVPHTQSSTDYERSLCLDSALATISYTADSISYTREVWCSNPDQVIAVRLACGVPRHLSFVVSLDGGDNPYALSIAEDGDLLLDVLGDPVRCGVG